MRRRFACAGAAGVATHLCYYHYCDAGFKVPVSSPVSITDVKSSRGVACAEKSGLFGGIRVRREHRFARSMVFPSIAHARAYSAPTSDSPFSYDALEKVIAARKERAANLEKLAAASRYQVWVLSRKFHLGEIDEATFKAKIAQVKKAVIPKAHALVYGTEATAGPQSRAEYLEKYGCVRWTDVAMAAIAKECPSIIELGAGSGKWKRRLEAEGCNVIAYDAATNVTFIKEGEKNGVMRGDHTSIAKHAKEGRALMLVYPPDGPMACDCLAAYAGNTLVYVGEGVGGCNADDDFFHELLQSWTVVVDMALDPYQGCAEKLFILKRKL